MTKRDFATIACKLLGVYFFVTSIGAVPTFIFTLVTSFATASLQSFGWINLFSIAVGLLNATITAGIGLLLWFKAQRCAERIFPEDSPPTTLAANQNFVSIALSVTGVIVLAFILPHLLSITITYLTLPETLSHVPMEEIVKNRIDAWGSVFQVLIGIWLIFGAGPISRMIKAVAHFTQDKEA